jgi:hypothetical protein
VLVSSKLIFEMGKTRFGFPTVEVREKQRGGFNANPQLPRQFLLSASETDAAKFLERGIITKFLDRDILDRAMRDIERHWSKRK